MELPGGKHGEGKTFQGKIKGRAVATEEKSCREDLEKSKKNEER